MSAGIRSRFVQNLSGTLLMDALFHILLGGWPNKEMRIFHF